MRVIRQTAVGGHCKKTAEHPNNYDKKNERNFFNT